MSLSSYWRIHREREILRDLSKRMGDQIRALTYDWMRAKGQIEKLNKRLGEMAEPENEKISIPIEVIEPIQKEGGE